MRSDSDRHGSDGVAAPVPASGLATAVLEVKGLNWASEKAIVEATLGRLEGVLTVEANPVAQTATVAYDPSVTSVAGLRRWIEDCGYHCAGRSVPGHICHPMDEPGGADHTSAHGTGGSAAAPTGDKDAPPSPTI